MTVFRVMVLLLAAALASRAALWLRTFRATWLAERRAKTVFPASEAAELLHPARRLKDPARAMVTAFGMRAGQRVLELGPGPGYFTAEAANAVGATGRVIAVDLQPGMIQALRRHLSAEALARVAPIVADAMHLPLASASFDCAYLVAVLGEVPEAQRTLGELRRVLRPGGIVAFSETLTDPDYVHEGDLRQMCADAGMPFLDRRRHALSYTMRFVMPS